MSKRLRIEDFIEKARERHCNYYDYRKVKYVYAEKKIQIICPKHGEFQQSPAKHLEGQGCPLCAHEHTGNRCRTTRDAFIARARVTHGDLYDYSLVEYKNSHTKVTIICPKHGEFQQTPGNHTHKTNPQGCPTCGGRSVWTKERFITEAKQVHGSKYSYDKVIFTDSVTGVVILCPEHGEFVQDAQHHIRRKQGCPKCVPNAKKNTEDFIRKARAIHNDKYDYSNTVYVTNHQNVCIICTAHGIFLQSPANHTHKTNPQGCPKCTGKIPWTKDRFLLEARLVHFDKYDYSLVDWKGFKSLCTIICPYYGEFKQSPLVHLMGCGCQKCLSPRGETTIRELLNKKTIKYEEQKSFQDCKDKNSLPFDFLIFEGDRQLIIEYHGAQHYQPVSFGGKKVPQNEVLSNFESIKKRDDIKRNWCNQKGIPLLEIPYTKNESEISDLIDEFIKL